MKAVLINVTSDGKSKPVPLSHERTLIGRLDDCQIRVPSGQISRHHCEIVLEDGELVLRDLNSSNGTYLNQSRTTEATLKPGDLIGLGSLVFVVQIDDEPSEIEPEFMYEDGVPDDAGQGGASQQSAPKAAPSEPDAPSTAPMHAVTKTGDSDESSMMDFNFEFDLDDEDLDEQPPL